MVGSYKRKLRAKRFQYDEDRDNFRRALRVLIDFMQWQFIVQIIIAAILLAALLGVSIYLLITP